MGAAGRGPSASVASSLQPPEDDAAIVGAVRLLSVLVAALTMDLAGRKVLLFVSGESAGSCMPARRAPPAAGPPEVGAVVLGAPRGPACTHCSREVCWGLREQTGPHSTAGLAEADGADGEASALQKCPVSGGP